MNDYNCFDCKKDYEQKLGVDCVYKKIAIKDFIIYQDTGSIEGSESNPTTLTDMLEVYLNNNPEMRLN